MADPSTTPPSARQRGCATVFFGFFFLLGSLFTVFMLFAAWQIAVSYTWERTECEILYSSGRLRGNVPDDEPPFEFVTHYRYLWRGRIETSSLLSLGGAAFSDWAKIHRLTEKYPAGSRVDCFVDPDAPSYAVLERQHFWMLLFLPLPLLFVAIGVGGAYFTWFGGDAAKEKVAALSAGASHAKRNWAGLIVFAVFLLAGFGVLFGVFYPPAMRIIDSRSWEPVPCVVEFSRVGVHEGDDSTTYSVDVLYAYEYGGREFRSSRYRHLNIASSGYGDKRGIVQSLPPGTEATCYVDPEAPEMAVMDRSFPPIMFLALLPLGFLLAGSAGMRHQWSKLHRRTVGGIPTPDYQPGPVMLESQFGKWGRLFGAFFFASIWNGIVGFALYQISRDWQRGNVEWFLVLFMVPFVLVGLAALVAIIYYLLALFNPRPVLKLSQAVLQPGSAATLDWSLKGNASAVRRLNIHLEGTEQVTERRGKKSRTRKEVFCDAAVFDSGEGTTMGRGTATVRVPRNAMHSFESGATKILWTLHVTGSVDRWPDIDEEFPVNVFPMSAPGLGGSGEEEEAPPPAVSSGGVSLTLERARYLPGATVEGTADWNLTAPPKNLSVRLFWRVEGGGSEHSEVVAEQRFEDAGERGLRPFRLDLPALPHSYSGTHFSIKWAVELVAGSPDAVARAEITVGWASR
jgi:hypothetical protein